MTEEQKRPTLKLSVIKPNLEKLQAIKPPIKYEKIKEEKPTPAPKFMFSPQELRDLYKLVRKKFPNAFPAEEEQPKILAIGIHKELSIALKMSMNKAKTFCKIYCSRRKYIEARVKGVPRYDLNGTVVGEV